MNKSEQETSFTIFMFEKFSESTSSFSILLRNNRNSGATLTDIKLIAGTFAASEWQEWGECQVASGDCGHGVRFRENSRLRSDSEDCFKICSDSILADFSKQMPGKIRVSCPNSQFCLVEGDYKQTQAGNAISYEKEGGTGPQYKLQYLKKGTRWIYTIELSLHVETWIQLFHNYCFFVQNFTEFSYRNHQSFLIGVEKNIFGNWSLIYSF